MAKNWNNKYLFNNYDTSRIAMRFWKDELKRTFQAKRFLVEQAIPYLTKERKVRDSVRLQNDIGFGVPEGYLETKHYNWTLVQEDGIDIVLMRSSTSITAFILFKIQPEDNGGLGAMMRFHYPHPYMEMKDTPYVLAIVTSSGEYSDDQDDEKREDALIASIDHLKEKWKKNNGSWHNEMIWNRVAVKRDDCVKLECLYQDDSGFQELPSRTYSYVMFQLSCLHIYMAGKQYG